MTPGPPIALLIAAIAGTAVALVVFAVLFLAIRKEQRASEAQSPEAPPPGQAADKGRNGR